jgi:hypothetical protein
MFIELYGQGGGAGECFSGSFDTSIVNIELE